MNTLTPLDPLLLCRFYIMPLSGSPYFNSQKITGRLIWPRLTVRQLPFPKYMAGLFADGGLSSLREEEAIATLLIFNDCTVTVMTGLTETRSVRGKRLLLS